MRKIVRTRAEFFIQFHRFGVVARLPEPPQHRCQNVLMDINLSPHRDRCAREIYANRNSFLFITQGDTMSEIFGTPEETAKWIDERIVQIRQQLEAEKLATHERCVRIEQDSRQRIRDAERDFYDRCAPMQRELDELLKVATIKHAYSPIPPMIVPAKDFP